MLQLRVIKRVCFALKKSHASHHSSNNEIFVATQKNVRRRATCFHNAQILRLILELWCSHPDLSSARNFWGHFLSAFMRPRKCVIVQDVHEGRCEQFLQLPIFDGSHIHQRSRVRACRFSTSLMTPMRYRVCMTSSCVYSIISIDLVIAFGIIYEAL